MINKISIIRESRTDDNRTPLTPKHIKELISRFPDIKIFVQPSKHRCFFDQEYEEHGAIIKEDLTDCDLILGVKEIDPDLLIPSKNYIFFSHTAKIQSDNSAAIQGTPGMDKKILLKAILDKKITLIDYENIRDNLSRRYLGFGRFAGIVGCYNTLNLFLSHNKYVQLGRAYKINDYERLKNNLKSIIFPKIKLLVTGDGRVAKGVLELLRETNILQVSKDEFLKSEIDKPIFCNLQTKDYVTHPESNEFDLHHFINFSNQYSSAALPYLKESNIFISAHYWDPSSPKIFEKNQLDQFSKLEIIGDITCDIEGSVPTTIRSSTIENPIFYLDRQTLQETHIKENNLAIMAVDNLPSELPRDASFEFSDGIVNHVLPFLLEKDDGRIFNATIAKEGHFLEKYNYLKNFINS